MRRIHVSKAANIPMVRSSVRYVQTLTSAWITASFSDSFIQGKMSRSDTRVYCGNLPPDIRARDIEDLFYKYGRISFVDLKTRRGPPFAFVEFEDPR